MDVVIANGENSAGGKGLSQASAEELFRAGVDVITTGNHVWHERAPEITRPIQVGAGAQASLTLTLDARGYRFVQHKDKNGRSYGDRSRRY